MCFDDSLPFHVAAQRMGEELIKQSEAMAAFPLSGRMVPEKKDPLIPRNPRRFVPRYLPG
jgi:hypothetical protein